MSKWNGWTVEKAGQSLAPSRLSSPGRVKGRLEFSYAKTPSPVMLRRPYGNMDAPPSTNGRLRDYHMSRQDPTVLDRMYTSAPSSPALRQSGYLYQTPPSAINHVTHTNGLGSASSFSRNSRTPLPTSLLRQTLTSNHRSSLPGGSSLVNVATQRRVSGTSRNFSPVIVRLSGPASSSEVGGGTMEVDETRAVVDPCDKDTVISALKKKRKRWAISGTDENSGQSDAVPSAKRTRLEPTFPSPRPQPKAVDRKRRNQFPAIPQTAKRTRLPPTYLPRDSPSHQPVSRPRVVIPEIEYESDKELEQSDATAKPIANKITRDKESGSLGSSRSSTPSVQEEEEELRKKREELVRLEKSLTTVFPSLNSEASIQRRKVPIFCATGTKPHIPSRPVLSYSATQGDLQRDRDAAAAKLKEFLTAEDDEEVKKGSEKESTVVKEQSPTTGLLPPSTPPLIKPAISSSPPSFTAPTTVNLSGSSPVPCLGGTNAKPVSDTQTAGVPAKPDLVAKTTQPSSLGSAPVSTSASLVAKTSIGSTSLQTVLGLPKSSAQASTSPVETSSPAATTTTVAGKTSLSGGGLVLKGTGIKLGLSTAAKSVSFSLSPPTVSIATNSLASLTVPTQSTPPTIAAPSTTLTGGIPLGKGLKLGLLGGMLAPPTTSSSTATPTLNFKSSTFPAPSATATPMVSTTGLPSSGLLGLPHPPSSSSSTPLSLQLPGGTGFGALTSTQISSTSAQNSSSGTPQPPIAAIATQSEASQASITTPQSQQPLGGFSLTSSVQPRLSLGLQTSGAGGISFPTPTSVTITSGTQSLAGIFSQTSSQIPASNTPAIFGNQTQPATAVLNLAASSTGFTLGAGTNLFPPSLPSQPPSLPSQPTTQGQSQETSQAQIFGVGSGGLFPGTSGQSQTFNFTGARSGQAGAQNQTLNFKGATANGQSGAQNQSQALNFSGVSSSQTKPSFNFTGASSQSSTLGSQQSQPQGGQSLVTTGGGSSLTFNFPATASAPSQTEGLFGTSTSSAGISFNFSTQKSNGASQQGQLQLPGTSGGLALPPASTGNGGFNFSAGMQNKPSFNFTAGTTPAMQDGKSAGASTMFNFLAQSNTNFGAGGQQTQGTTGLFNQPQSQTQSTGGLFNQPQSTGGLFNQTQSQRQNAGGIFGQTQSQTQSSGGLFNPAQGSTGGLFNQTAGNGLFNQTQSAGGMLGQTQSTGGLFGQTQAPQGQPSGGAVFNFTGGATPQQSNVFGSQTGGQGLAFGGAFQSPQPQSKLSFGTPGTNGVTPTVNFTAGSSPANTRGSRPMARARRRARK